MLRALAVAFGWLSGRRCPETAVMAVVMAAATKAAAAMVAATMAVESMTEAAMTCLAMRLAHGRVGDDLCRGGHGGALLPTFWVWATATAAPPRVSVPAYSRAACVRATAVHAHAGCSA